MSLDLSKFNQPLSTKERDRKTLRYLLLAGYILVAQIATNLSLRATNADSRASLVELANFTAWRPYQYRLLIPAIVHFIARSLHASPEQFPPIYQLIEILSFAGALAAFRTYLATYLAERDATIYSFSIAIPMLLIHVSDAMLRYPSDTPQVALFTLCIVFLRKQNWKWLYVITALAMLNRESTALIVIAFAATMYGIIPRLIYFRHLIGLTTLCLAIRLLVTHLFAHNPGSSTESHIGYNLGLFHELLTLQPNVLFTTLLVAGLTWLIFAYRKVVPTFALRLLVIVPCYCVGMFFVGVFDEVRAYNELVPVVLTPLLLVFDGLLKAEELKGQGEDEVTVGEDLRVAA